MALTTTARPVAGSSVDADIAEVRVRHRAQVGHSAGVVQADERLAGIAFFVDGISSSTPARPAARK